MPQQVEDLLPGSVYNRLREACDRLDDASHGLAEARDVLHGPLDAAAAAAMSRRLVAVDNGVVDAKGLVAKVVAEMAAS